MNSSYLISVGNELLNGQRADTNSVWLQGQMLSLGIATAGVCLVPDETERIVHAMKEASALADVIVMTGGLGPTEDDLTRYAAAEFVNEPLELREDLLKEIELFFTRRGVPMASTNRVQACLPKGAQALGNSRGTAPGIFLEYRGKWIVCLPGVPAEMKSMFLDFVRPKLEGQAGGRVILMSQVHCFGAGESTIAEKLGDLMKRGRNPLINTTAHVGNVDLHIIAESEDENQAAKLIEQDRQRLTSLLGDWVWGFDRQTLPGVVNELLIQNGKTLALAESCTGGLTAKLITDIPGSSRCFRAGWITYSNEAKMRDLDVPEELIREYGAVSESVACALAQGARRKSAADLALGITGIAGPEGGTEEKPVGLVYICLDDGGRCETEKHLFSQTDRDSIRIRAALTALNRIRLKLKV